MRLSAPRRAQLFRPHSPWANATTAATRCCLRSKIERRRSRLRCGVYATSSQLLRFFRNDPAPRAIALTTSMPEAFTDFNSARRMLPHCERSVCISSLGARTGGMRWWPRSGRAAIKNVPQCHGGAMRAPQDDQASMRGAKIGKRKACDDVIRDPTRQIEGEFVCRTATH